MAESSYTLAAAPTLLNAAPPETVGLALHLFGPMEVRVAGRPLPRLRSRKGLWLLALLALRAGGDVERDWLAATLWPDCHEADAKRSLRQSLHDLRAALGNEAARLTSQTPRTLRLDVSPGAFGIWVDLHLFDAATDRRKSRLPDSLENALRLYRGPLLEDCAEDWVIDARRQREIHYLSALETLASAASATSGFGAAADYLRRAVLVAPLREDLQRALMEALAASGNLPAALLVFRQFRARLWQETASEPDAQTTALYRQLRDEARKAARIEFPSARPAPSAVSPAAETPSAHLPQPRTPLVGRESEAGSVVSGLARSRLVTLTGTGGVGKTRLALRVAEMLGDDFEGGAHFVDLAPLTDSSAVPEAVGKALGVAPESRPPFTPVLCRALSTRRLFLVLDNCEQVLDACARLVDALLSTCPGVRVLATSRQTLGLSGETVWRVPSLAIPPLKAAAETLEHYAAVQLFIARAREVDSTFQITSRSAPTVARVCRRLDGIPLAIELAAARLQALTVEEIDARLDNQFRLLTGGDRAALPRQQTLRGALDWSWNLLTGAEQNLLADLSVFAGGWTLEAAETVCARADLDTEEVLELLTALLDKSLVLAEKQENGTTRYRLLETVRQYGRERLIERGEAEAALVCTRHQTYFAELTAQLVSNFGAQKAATLTQIETEYDNLRAALDWEGGGSFAETHTTYRALDIAGRLIDYWRTNGYLREGQERLRAVLSRAENGGEAAQSEHLTARARAQYGMASMLREQGEYAAARLHYDKALSAYRQMNDTSNVAAMLSEIGLVALWQSDYPTAQALLEEGLALYRDLGDQRCIGKSLSSLGVIAGGRGNLAQARVFLEEALHIHRTIKNEQGIAVVLNNLGINAREQGDPVRARTLFEDALLIHQSMNNARSVAIARINLGGVLSDLGDYAEAEAHLQQALVFFQESGNKDATAATLSALGMAAMEQGDASRARPFLTPALKLHRELGNQKDVALTVLALAAVEAEQGRPGNALRLWGAAEQVRERIGAPLPPNERDDYEKRVAHARATLADTTAATTAWAEGQAMDFESMCEQALSE